MPKTPTASGSQKKCAATPTWSEPGPNFPRVEIKAIRAKIAEKPHKELGLNLALVIDVAGSMYEEDGTGISRLKRIQDAAKSVLNKLKPTDTVAIVAYAHDTKVFLPSTAAATKAKIEEATRINDTSRSTPCHKRLWA